MRRKRRALPAEFKSKVALAALCGNLTLNQVAAKYEVPTLGGSETVVHLPASPTGPVRRCSHAAFGQAVHAKTIYGVEQMTDWLRRQGHTVGQDRVRRLLRKIELMAIYPKPRTSQPNNEHQVYQGAQFTRPRFLQRLESAQVRTSMDRKGRFLDNIFVERLWRTVKYEEVYLNDYENVWEAEDRIGSYFAFYNRERPHRHHKPRRTNQGPILKAWKSLLL